MSAPVFTKIRVAVLAAAARMVFALPGRLLTLIFGRPPEVASGLRPDAWALCRIAGLVEKDASKVTVEEMRQDTEELAQVVTREPDPGVTSKDFDLGVEGHPLHARLYVPAAAPASGPLMVYFHGGGWVVGSLDTHDRACRRLARAGGTRILAVDYRLAPEHPFPAAPDDALTAWQAVQADPDRFGADLSRIGAGGDSAGGNLAAVLCQDLRDMGQAQPLYQLLIYPVVKVGAKTRSKADFARDFYLTTERMDWYDAQYSPGDLRLDHRASPALNEDLSGLAPAYIVSALADPLRDEAEDYARNLEKAGVPVRLDRMPLVHAWFNVTLSRSSIAAHEVVADQIRRYLAEVPDPATSISGD
ncbi:MAG: alpha/beta hydrolase fold domain-containing protein [Thermoleophilia bacterium]|nr:alpha/beta hydrolase fold domain-containing protein [Thermoleophilia bacterium]